jgi:hypothetical protein
VGQAVRERAAAAGVAAVWKSAATWVNPRELGRKHRGERKNGWIVAYGVGSGGASGGPFFPFLHLEDSPIAVNCGLVVNGTKCQPQKIERAKCKRNYRLTQMEGLDHLR